VRYDNKADFSKEETVIGTNSLLPSSLVIFKQIVFGTVPQLKK